MKRCKLKIISFVSPEGPRARYNNTGMNSWIFILLFMVIICNKKAKHDFSVWLRTGSSPADINRFRSYTKKKLWAFYVACMSLHYKTVIFFCMVKKAPVFMKTNLVLNYDLDLMTHHLEARLQNLRPPTQPETSVGQPYSLMIRTNLSAIPAKNPRNQHHVINQLILKRRR